jgi:hypothetical protein
MALSHFIDEASSGALNCSGEPQWSSWDGRTDQKLVGLDTE